MKPRSLAAFVVLALSVVPIAPAQVKAQGEGYLLRTRYVVGQVTVYKIRSSVTIAGGREGIPTPPAGEADLRQEVVSVKDGIATLKMETTTLTPGADGNTPAPTTQTVRVDETGRTVDENGKPAGTNPSGGFGGGLPLKPVKIGESWETEEEPKTGGSGAASKIKVKSTFAGIETKDERSLAKVEFAMTMAGATPTEGSGTVLLDVADGQLVSMTMKTGTTVTIPGGDGPMTVTVALTIERV